MLVHDGCTVRRKDSGKEGFVLRVNWNGKAEVKWPDGTEMCPLNELIAVDKYKELYEELVANTSPWDKHAADIMAAAIDVLVYRKCLDSRSIIADARLDYGDPFPIEVAEEMVFGKIEPIVKEPHGKEKED